MRRLITRVLDLGVVALLLLIPTALGNRAGVDESPRTAASVASYCDSMCPGVHAALSDED